MSEKLAFLERLLGTSKYSSSTQEAEFTCCFEGCSSISKGKKKLSVNIETDNFKCWVCGKVGRNLFFLIAHVGNKADVNLYNERFKAKTVKKTSPDVVKFKIELPRHYRPLIECKNSLIGKKAMAYLAKYRGVSEDDILRHKIGVITEGSFAGRLVFPSFDRVGKLNFFTTRAIGEKGFYSVPIVPRDYKNHIILNELNTDWNKPLTIVEGFVDMLKANENCVPLFGSSLHKDAKLFQQIVHHNVPVFLALDPDAQKKALKIAEMFMSYDIPVYQVPVAPFKDVGDMSKQEFLARYNSSHLLSDSSILRERIRLLA